MRLQKYLASCGICSRRKAEAFILAGKVKVNGKIAILGQKIQEDKDEIYFEGEIIRPKKKLYYLLNKPKGYTCSLHDRHAEKLVGEIFLFNERIYPVGRLDRETEGLLLMTNDGDFANRVIHPRQRIEKEYEVGTLDELNLREISLLKKGILLDGVIVKMAQIERKNDDKRMKVYSIVIYEGRKRQIRRMFEKINKNIVYLKRIRIGKLFLSDLPIGQYRTMTQEEIDLFN